MICDVFTAATCSRLVNQTPTHTDEPHLRGAGALLQIHPAAQQEAAVAIVTARSTGGVCGSESVHWHSFLLKRWCYTAVCLLFAIQEVFTPALKDRLTHNFVTLEVRVCGERLGNSRILKKGEQTFDHDSLSWHKKINLTSYWVLMMHEAKHSLFFLYSPSLHSVSSSFRLLCSLSVPGVAVLEISLWYRTKTYDCLKKDKPEAAVAAYNWTGNKEKHERDSLNTTNQYF